MYHLFLFGMLLLPQAASFQQHNRWNFPNHGSTAQKIRNSRLMLFSDSDASMQSSSKQKQPHSFPMLPLIFMSTAFGLCLCGSPQMTCAAADTDPRPSTSQLLGNEETTTISTSASISPAISNYFGQVFQSPSPGATPLPPRFDNPEARNRAYDEAFEQDARDRDAYYGKMAALKQEEALRDVRRNREALGLDGNGDLRLRVGEEKVAGMASLKEYLLQQDPSTLTPAELRVYEQAKQDDQ